MKGTASSWPLLLSTAVLLALAEAGVFGPSAADVASSGDTAFGKSKSDSINIAQGNVFGNGQANPPKAAKGNVFGSGQTDSKSQGNGNVFGSSPKSTHAGVGNVFGSTSAEPTGASGGGVFGSSSGDASNEDLYNNGKMMSQIQSTCNLLSMF